MLKAITLSIISLLVLCSCGTPGGEDGAKKNVTRQTSKLETSTKVKFDCFEEGQCTDSFVLFINSSSEFPKYCTGYMADEQHMVVPSHCVTDASCSSIAAKTTNGRVYQCGEILEDQSQFNEQNTYNGNFTTIRLKEAIPGDYAAVSENKMSDFSYYQLWFVKKKLDNTGYELNRMRYNCRKTNNNVLFPNNNKESSAVAMKNCNIRDDSMGAGVVDTRTGDVLGLVHGSVNEDKTFRRFMHGRKGSTLTIATPIKCVIKKFNIANYNSEDTQYCDEPVFRPGTAQHSQKLSQLFRFNNRNISYVFTRLAGIGEDFLKYREYFALSYESVPYQYPRVRICEFQPFLNRSYEIYGRDFITTCIDSNLDIVFKESHFEKSFSIYDDFGDIALKVLYK
ncbi:hypothetical protein ABMA70_03615 [Halobacteriovorax sp. XZX-3]|uniref:hypothetical protein n=1 Tax=unclassified Halobacteriovorax TaxID=2639665 RepID=UPI0037189DA8